MSTHLPEKSTPKSIKNKTHPSNLQLNPPLLHPRLIHRWTQLPRFTLPFTLPYTFPTPHGSSSSSSSTAAAEPTFTKRLGRESVKRDKHAEVVPITEIFERLRGVFNCQLCDLRAGEDVMVY